MRLKVVVSFIIPLLISITLMPSIAHAEQQAEADSEQLSLAINTELGQLVNQVIDTGLPYGQRLEKQLAVISISNDAEQLLVDYLKGYHAFRQQEYPQAISWLEKAKALAEKLPKQQLNQREFIQFHLLLADSYAAIKDFDNAYSEKRAYLIKSYDFRVEYDKEMLNSLEEKYQINSKEQQNQLLDRQNALKQSEVKKAQLIEQQQERNTVILICLSVVFLLMIIRQVKVRSTLLWMTQTDSLTHIHNRGSLFEHGHKFVQAAAKDHDRLSAVLLDVDDFKQINDQYGHDVGDEVLKLVAQLGLEVMRSRDVFARLGGEEFVALLPDASLEEARTIAHRLRDKIAAASFSDKGLDFNITASFGVASLSQVNPNFDALIKAADQAMYLAKAQGKNKVVNYLPAN